MGGILFRLTEKVGAAMVWCNRHFRIAERFFLAVSIQDH